jgi:hypothetical protein
MVLAQGLRSCPTPFSISQSFCVQSQLLPPPNFPNSFESSQNEQQKSSNVSHKFLDANWDLFQ